ncbi:hypothetical protein HDU96_010732 [Phlyctochytrium bullatum]|nr:hypothetical protein HDU96_010732 [Phlyctochytrium bullatum]
MFKRKPKAAKPFFLPFPTPSSATLTQDVRNTVSRPVAAVRQSGIFTEGAGFKVRRPFPVSGFEMVDPILMLDHLGPTEYGPYEFLGAPNHPHRGFCTVSYIIAGETQHHDSSGYEGVMRPGWVQWMTAGSGVIHDERPTDAFAEAGGVVEGFQVWVNLPKAKKMIEPSYQDYAPERMPKLTLLYPSNPSAEPPSSSPTKTNPLLQTLTGASTPPSNSAWCNVIAGEAHGYTGPVESETPMVYIHYILRPGAKVAWHVPQAHRDDWGVFCYVSKGRGRFGQGIDNDASGGVEAKLGDLVLFDRKSGIEAGEGKRSAIVFANEKDAEEELSVLLIGGKPLDEPVARRGPFVMNTDEEILQAFKDFAAGRLGKSHVNVKH